MHDKSEIDALHKRISDRLFMLSSLAAHKLLLKKESYNKDKKNATYNQLLDYINIYVSNQFPKLDFKAEKIKNDWNMMDNFIKKMVKDKNFFMLTIYDADNSKRAIYNFKDIDFPCDIPALVVSLVNGLLKKHIYAKAIKAIKNGEIEVKE
jgi:hypothetical protein